MMRDVSSRVHHDRRIKAILSVGSKKINPMIRTKVFTDPDTNPRSSFLSFMVDLEIMVLDDMHDRTQHELA
jgi:hypothetical protein